MANQSLVSVVLPTFNRAYCVARAIDSVLQQTYSNCEVVVIDDGSTDGTRTFVADRYGSNERVRYVVQANAGVAAARNTGIKAARGDFIALLDSDDVWKKWKIAAQLACLQALPEVGMIWTDMEAVDPRGVRVAERYLRTMYHAYTYFAADGIFSQRRALGELAPDILDVAADVEVAWGDVFSHMVMGNLVHTSTALLTRERLRRVGGFNEALRITGEDYDFHLRTCREGPVAYLDVPSILYQVGGADQLTHSSLTLHMAQNFLRTIEPVIEKDRARIQLPDSMIRRVLAEAHGWIGREMLANDRNREARREISISLKHRPQQGMLWAFLTLACMPPALTKNIRAGYRRVRDAVR